GINIVDPCNAEPPPPSPAMYQLDIVLKKGNNLAIRDRTTSDPYVKFKIAGKEVFRSKTIHKNLNPVWDERATLLVESLRDPLYVKVFDYDFGLQDDFMGSAYLYLESLEHQTLEVVLDLKDPHYPDHNLGSLELSVTLSPREGDMRDATMLLRRNWKRSSKCQSMRLSDVHRKAQLWRGIVSISLIEGRGLQPMDDNGRSDPYVKFRMGHQKYKSKTIPKTLNPQWREQFDFHMYEEQGGYVDITVWDKDAGKKDDFMGCTIDLSLLSKEHTHKLELPLEEGEGVLVMLVTLTASAAVSISDLSVNVLDDPQERHQIKQRYQSLWRSLHNLKDVGVVQVKVIRAEGLMAADVTKSDPFCIVELSNDRLQTHTVYKNLNPEWNKVFTNVKDIHSVLEVTVYDEDRDRSADFLGKVAIPLLKIQNGERKAYALKSKELTGPTKGVIFLEIDVIFNAVYPLILSLFVVLVWNFELYMIPLALLLPLAWNYILITSGKDTRQDVVMEDLMEDEDEDFDKDDRDSERKGFMNKLYAIQDVCISVQNALDEVASYGERIKTFNWTVPFLSWLAIVALGMATVIVYVIPLRYIVLAWGVNKFTKKLRDPYAIDNNEIFDFLSRVPSDVQV
uniref:Multiple C2 and transmembrane domain containing 1 n=1 Tax=Hippocampus comes TaxID=109280 RepID=A0A3Q2YCX9_HIPCM